MCRFLPIFIAVVLLSSCKNIVPYTDTLRKQQNWSEEQVKTIQFYLSSPIILQRKVTDASSDIVAGTIKIVNGQKVDEVIISSGTPGVLVGENNNLFNISFEKGDDYTLQFGSNQYMDYHYSLAFSDIKNSIGKLTYNGVEYYTSPESLNAILMVDLRKINKTQLNQRIAEGRKVK